MGVSGRFAVSEWDADPGDVVVDEFGDFGEEVLLPLLGGVRVGYLTCGVLVAICYEKELEVFVLPKVSILVCKSRAMLGS